MLKHFTYNYKVVTSITLAAFVTRPVFIPNMCAIGHMTSTFRLAHRFGHATLRNVILFKGSLREIGLTSPAYFGATDIFTRFACFNRIQTLFHIARLIGANITFQASNKINCNYNEWLNC